MNLKGTDASRIMEAELARLTHTLQREIEARKFAIDPPKQTCEQKFVQLKEKFNATSA